MAAYRRTCDFDLVRDWYRPCGRGIRAGRAEPLDWLRTRHADVDTSLAAFRQRESACRTLRIAGAFRSAIFGVTDSPRSIVGVDNAFPDEAVWANSLRGAFAPEIDFAVREYNINGRIVVAVGVDRGRDLPVVCTRDSSASRIVGGKQRSEPLLQQGAIYYRQAGQTRPIHYLELRSILERRDSDRLAAFMQNLKIISDVGPDKIGILDMSKGVDEGQATRLYLSRETARHLNFIERGRFVESSSEGDPAYMVVGSVQLNQAVAGPLDPEDQNLPVEAADKLRPVVEELFWEGIPFTGHHLARLAKHAGIRGDAPADPRYCIEDLKVKRVYYTRAGIERLAQALRDRPAEALAAGPYIGRITTPPHARHAVGPRLARNRPHRDRTRRGLRLR